MSNTSSNNDPQQPASRPLRTWSDVEWSTPERPHTGDGTPNYPDERVRPLAEVLFEAWGYLIPKRQQQKNQGGQ